MNQEGSQSFKNERINVGIAFTRGGQDEMQDICVVNLEKDHSQDFPMDFMGVFDGHGKNGEKVAFFVASNLNDTVQMIFKKNNFLVEAIERGCLAIDDRLRASGAEQAFDKCGASCCVVWIRDKKLYSCNVGDARLMLSYNGDSFNTTLAHTPDNSWEYDRILKAGGQIVNKRINGVMDFARSFGDFTFKNNKAVGKSDQLVTSFPDVFVVDIDFTVEFVVIVSAGVLNVLEDQEIVNLVESHLKSDTPVDSIAKMVIKQCNDKYRKKGPDSKPDNMACVIAAFKHTVVCKS